MDKGFWKGLFVFLETASNNQLAERRDRLEAAIATERFDRDTAADAKRALRLINEEILAREALAKMPNL